MVTHVLFDFDGTLVDSVDNLISLVDEIIREHDPSLRITPEIQEFCPNLVSLSSLCNFINTSLNLSINAGDFTRTVLTKLPRRNLKLMPGVEKLVKHLHKHNIPMAVASGTLKSYYEKAITHFGDFFATYFHHALCAHDDDGVKNKKPAPDTFFVAAERFPNPPKDMSNVLILEDSFTGLEGAISSGAKIVLITKSTAISSEANAEKVKKTDLIIKSLEEFKPEQFGLPPYDN